MASFYFCCFPSLFFHFYNFMLLSILYKYLKRVIIGHFVINFIFLLSEVLYFKHKFRHITAVAADIFLIYNF